MAIGHEIRKACIQACAGKLATAKLVKGLAALAVTSLAVISLAVISLAGQAQAQSVEDFYKGKTIEVIIGYSAGGGYDTYARAVTRHMTNHMPGKPSFVARQMPGGGSRVAANFLYNVASKEGLVIGIVDQSLALSQVLGEPALKLDAAKFLYIGNPISDNNTMVAWHTTGITRWEQAKEKQLSLGATGPNTSAWYGMAMNAMLGTKFKIITGYPGGNDINLALEKGEVDVRGSNAWASWKGTRPQWLTEKKINILVQIGLAREPDLPDVPLLMDLPADPDDKAALRLLSAPTTIGRPLFAPPGVPAARIKALRDAFDATMKDPAFIAEAKATKLDLQPLSGMQLQKIVEDIVATPPNVVQRLKKVLEMK
jgi:tripartite-type tricarboxylate transporter receptor subunit TctC